MEEYTKDELVSKLDTIIEDDQAKFSDLVKLIFDAKFPAEFFEDAVKDLEEAIAEQKAGANKLGIEGNL